MYFAFGSYYAQRQYSCIAVRLGGIGRNTMLPSVFLFLELWFSEKNRFYLVNSRQWHTYWAVLRLRQHNGYANGSGSFYGLG